MELEYSEKELFLHEQIASGEAEETGKFQICLSGATMYLQCDKLKGEIPKIKMDLKSFVEAAVNYAQDNKLLSDG